jgi:hypothetical protein
MDEKNKHVFDNPQNTRWVYYVLVCSLVLLLAIEPFIHKHPYFAWDGWFGFYGFYGIIACVVLVLVSRYFIKPLLKRDENYYG